MKTLLTLLICLGITLTSSATNYYIAANGSDANSGTSETAPWQTLAKLNSFFSNIKAGDAILFKRGDTFYGSIIPTKNGSPSQPITFSAYGRGPKPVITGFTTVSSWTSLGNGIYKSAPIAEMPTGALNTVLINGTIFPMGRYPNRNAANKGYLTITSSVGNSSVTTNDGMTGVPDFTGATLVLRNNRWYISRNAITSQSGGTINYTAATTAVPPEAGFGFFIQNSPLTLDEYGEWYYDQKTKQLQIFTGGAAPTNVQVASSGNIDISNHSNYIFDNLAFNGSYGTQFSVTSSVNFTFQNLDIMYSGIDAISGAATTNFKVLNNKIWWANSNAIYLINYAKKINTNHLVSKNDIRNTGSMPGMAPGGTATSIGINLNGGKNVISYNYIDTTGYHGIGFYTGDSVLVENNVVKHFNYIKNDGGGIYTYNGGQNSIDYYGCIIRHNIVSNACHPNEGTPTPTSASWSSGIYLDNDTRFILVDSNTIFQTDRAIFSNAGSHDDSISANTCFDNEVGIYVSANDIKRTSTRNVNLVKNIVFAKSTTQTAALFTSSGTDIGLFGIHKGNIFAKPSDSTSIISIRTKQYTNAAAATTMSLGQWHSAYSNDINSKNLKRSLTSDDDVRFEYNPTDKPKQVALDKTYVDLDDAVHSDKLTLAPYSSKILIKKQ